MYCCMYAASKSDNWPKTMTIKCTPKKQILYKHVQLFECTAKTEGMSRPNGHFILYGGAIGNENANGRRSDTQMYL